MTSFTDLGVPRNIRDALAIRGVAAPFAIQSLTIADAMAGRDLCGHAPTGSGKTLAFGIPVAARARKGSPGRPSALILVPTRELAAQVADVIRPLGQARDLHTAAFYGGTSISKDRQRLERGVDIAVACPGRLADLVERGFADLRQVRLVVVDEADRMADMGFLPEVKRLLDQTHSDRQTLLFSATLDGDVDALIRRYQRDPVRREHESGEETKGDVSHQFWSTPAQERIAVTADLLRVNASAIVFTRTKHGADRLAKQLARRGVTAAAIHGNRSQSQRQRALADFAARRVTALVATDVAARGIHVDAVEVVVHYDPAGSGKDYVHRSGRTGRAGADGFVVTLVTPDKANDVRMLQRALGLPQGTGAGRPPAVTGTNPPRQRPSASGAENAGAHSASAARPDASTKGNARRGSSPHVRTSASRREARRAQPAPLHQTPR